MRWAVLGGVFTASQVCAQTSDLPLWEAGIGLGALHNPHYLGAEQTDTYVLPLPYFVYRGSYLRADRGGIRGLLYESDRLELRLSLGGSLPVNSDDNDARAGMDDLDLLIDAGPNLQYTLYQDDTHLWRLDLPVQGVFSLGQAFLYHRGWTSNPRVHYQRDIGDWTLTTSLGPVFSDVRFHRYFYDVGAEDVTAERPFYEAKSGYTGTRASLGLRRRVGEWFVGAYFRYYDLHGAANEDSPLVRQTDYFSAGLFLAWVFAESETKAVWDDDPDGVD